MTQELIHIPFKLLMSSMGKRDSVRLMLTLAKLLEAMSLQITLRLIQIDFQSEIENL